MGPRVIGDRFEIHRLVAEGGMGAVYRAHDRHTDALAAVKLIRSPDATSVERFSREARVLAELRHPGIVHYLTHGRTEDGELYLAMEWLDGEDLAQRLDSRELGLGEVLSLGMQVAAALAVAHARGIVHRDLKPANLFLADYKVDRVKLLDFGVARIARLDALTRTGGVVGTPRYMAPEQARGDKLIDARADLFALGAVLYRCLAGRHAFTGDTPGEVLGRVLLDDPPRLRELRPNAPRAVDDLLERMLAKQPARRPPNAAAVLSELLAVDVTPVDTGEAPPRAAAELTGEERRVCCVLLVGGVAPDERVRAIAAAHGGEVTATAAATLVVLSGQRVATDQAQSGARCALALRRHLPDAPMALTLGRRAGTTAGDADARADGLLAAATGAVIVLDAACAGLIGARFQIAGDGRGLLLRGERGVDDETRPLLGKPTPFVGRDQELAQLEASFDAAVRDGEARAVLVTAPAGTGKSRLRVELTRRLLTRGEPVEVWIGLGEPNRAGAPFALLGDAVRRAAGIAGDEPLAVRQRLLVERVGRRLSAERAPRVAELIGELCGVPFSAEDSAPLRAARREPSLLAERLRSAWAEWLAAECAARPVVLVLEDLHWGDLPTVKLLDHALGALAEQRFFVLALGRPEVRELFPRLWAERGLQEIHLAGLGRRAAERLVREALGDGAGDVASIVERAGGNAFFLEELIRHVAERGERTLPDTVLAMVEARFEQLGGEARRALRAASVFGEVFWAGGVAALVGGDPRAALADLAAAELIQRRHEPRLAHEEEHAFGHSLLREAAYALLTDEDRALGHQLAGDWLERAGEPEALVLAEHFERGREPARAAGWFARAAEQALAANDPAAAVARAERGVACGANGEALGTLRLLQALAYRLQGEAAATIAAAVPAMALLRRGSEPWYRATTEAAVACAFRLQVDDLCRFAADALAATDATPSAAAVIAFSRIAIQCGIGRGPRELFDTLVARLDPLPAHLESDPAVGAYVAEALSQQSVLASRPDEWHARTTRAEQLSRAIGDDRNACMQAMQLASYAAAMGNQEQACDGLRAAESEARKLGMPMAARLAGNLLSLALIALGRAADALEVSRRCSGGYEQLSIPLIACGVAGQLSRALAANDLFDEAETVGRAAVAYGSAAGSVLDLALIGLARLLARRGRGDEALALLARVPDRQLGEMTMYFWPAEAHLARVEALLACGRGDEARQAATRARAWVDEKLRRTLTAERWAVCARRNPVVEAILRLDAELS